MIVVGELALLGIEEKITREEIIDLIDKEMDLLRLKDCKEEPEPTSDKYFMDGDFCVCSVRGAESHISIIKGHIPKRDVYVGYRMEQYVILYKSHLISKPYEIHIEPTSFSDSKFSLRMATEAEKQLLLDELRKLGYRWDAKRMSVMKDYSSGKFGVKFYVPRFDSPSVGFTPEITWSGRTELFTLGEHGWVFETEDECKAFVDKLNTAFKSVSRD